MTTTNDGGPDTTNAGPVLPAVDEEGMRAWLANAITTYAHRYAEHVAGPLRKELAQVHGYLETLTQRCVDDTAENGVLRERVAELKAQQARDTHALLHRGEKITRLRAENQALRADAERYRALRRVLKDHMTDAQYDACIDAARAARENA